MGPNGIPFPAGSEELARQCAMPQYRRGAGLLERGAGPCAAPDRLRRDRQRCSAMRAILALPSVILILLFGQTRIFFVMARDGLLPEKLSKVHPKWKTPYVVTAITGVVVAVRGGLPAGRPARRHRQCRNALRLLDGGDRGDDAAQDAIRTASARSGCRALIIIGPLTIARLPVPVLQPADRGDAGPADLVGRRLPDLLRLQPPQQPSRPGHRRSP